MSTALLIGTIMFVSFVSCAIGFVAGLVIGSRATVKAMREPPE